MTLPQLTKLLSATLLTIGALGFTMGAHAFDEEEPPRHAVEMCTQRCVEIGGFDPRQCQVSCEEDYRSH